MAEAAKRRRGSRKTNKPIDLEKNADRPQWAGKQEAKEKEDRLRLAKQIPFWREGERPKVGDYLLAYFGFEKRGNSGFFIARIAKINTENFDTQYFVYFFLSKATVKRTFHLLQPIYTWMKSEGKGRNCRPLKDENGNFYDLEKSCVVRFLNKASATKPRSYTKRYKGKEPKKRKRKVQEQKAPPLLAPPKRTAMAAAGPSSATQKREKPGTKGKWMRDFFKQETENDSKQEMEDDSETDDEPEPNEKDLEEKSVREFQKLLLF